MSGQSPTIHVGAGRRKHLFPNLRSQMLEQGVEQTDLADALQRGITYINLRMNGRKPWQIDEAYAILEFLGVPHDQIYTYFPPIPKAKSHKRPKRKKARSA